MSKIETDKIKKLNHELKMARALCDDWRKFALHVEAQRDRAFERIRMIGDGVCLSEVPEGWTYTERLRSTAARFFKSEAMRTQGYSKPWRIE